MAINYKEKSLLENEICQSILFDFIYFNIMLSRKSQLTQRHPQIKLPQLQFIGQETKQNPSTNNNENYIQLPPVLKTQNLISRKITHDECPQPRRILMQKNRKQEIWWKAWKDQSICGEQMKHNFVSGRRNKKRVHMLRVLNKVMSEAIEPWEHDQWQQNGSGDIIFVMSSHSSIDKLQTIRQKFIKDDDQIAQKSRFGYFSLTPSCFLNHSINSSSHDQNHISKPQTEKRNIFAGVTATGVLKKSYFSYVPSYNSGDVYLDPSKRENLCKIKEIEKKESFKPSNCTQVENFTLSYKYMSDPVKKIDPSQLKDERGKVKIGKANIMCSTNDRCEQQRNKIYLRETKSEKKLIKMEVPQLKTKDNKPSFKVGIFKNKQFSTGKDIYGSIDKLPIQKQQTKKQLKCHQNQFKPQNRSSSGPYDLFTKVSYFSGQIREQPPKKQLKKQGFFLGSRYQISKPCPSVSLSKLNLLRSLR